MISYINDSAQMANQEFKKDYIHTRSIALQKKDNLTICVESNGELYGTEIVDNKPLTKIYGFPVKVIRFIASRIISAKDPELDFAVESRMQKEAIREVFLKTHTFMQQNPAYYTMCFPGHVSDAMYLKDVLSDRTQFCGGKLEFASLDSRISEDWLSRDHKYGNIFYSDSEQQKAHREELIALAAESFSEIQSQYHVAAKTREKADDIYRDWMANALKDMSGKRLIVCEVDGHYVGFGLLNTNAYEVELNLTAVNNQYRGQGIYKYMLAMAICDAKKEQKMFWSGTQLDNFGSQRTWTGLGMKVFQCEYNLHFDYTI